MSAAEIAPGDQAEALLAQVVSRLAGAEVAVTVSRQRVALTRFANSVIHQNVAEDITTFTVQVHHHGRTATASAAGTGAADVVDHILAAVASAPLDPGWGGLAPATTTDTSPSAADDWAEREVSAATRADLVRGFVAGAGGLEAAGYCRTVVGAIGFVNSAGQSVSMTPAEVGLVGVARDVDGDGPRVDGVARLAPQDLADVDAVALGARAAAKARAARGAIELPAGRLEVVLEPTAVADILEALASAGFNGRAVNDGRSFVRLGTAQFDPAITLVDQPLPLGYSFDDEGTPRRELTLVEGGCGVAITHDRRTAFEAGTTSTGHCGEGAFSWGPIARHLSMLPRDGGAEPAVEVQGPAADSSVAELVAGGERGVLVSDFWYTRILDPRALTLTGLTRNGLWLIENGEITTPLRNFRFTQSYAQALMAGNVIGIGRTATSLPGDTYSASSPRWTCPALHLAGWNFTGGASG